MLFIDRALRGPFGIIREYLGKYRVGVGLYQSQPYFVEKMQDDALDYALKQGCNPEKVLQGKRRVSINLEVCALIENPSRFQGFPNLPLRRLPTVHEIH